MSNTLKSNWMGNSSASPTKFRAASNGKVFTRTERLKLIFAEKQRKEDKAKRLEVILQERNKAKAESEKRESFFKGLQTLAENPDSKIKHSKNGLFIQPRVNGSFGKKIAIG